MLEDWRRIQIGFNNLEKQWLLNHKYKIKKSWLVTVLLKK